MIRFLAVFFTLFLTLHLSAQTPPGNLLVKDGQTVAFMGDSITGMGWGVKGGFVHLVTDGLAANGVKITPIPAGVGGNRSTEMLARVDADVIAKKPDWLLLSCGVNDVWSRSVDLDTFKKQMTAIIDKVQAANIKIMILPPTPIYEASKNEFNDKLGGYVDFMKQIATERHFPVADIHQAWLDYIAAQNLPDNPNVVTVDGVHPNPDGHLLFAKKILAAFGATPDQVATAEKAWRAAPLNATVLSDFGFSADIPVTADELAALNKMAADQKIALNRLVHTSSIETSRDLLVKSDLSKVYSWDLNKPFGAEVKSKLDTLTNTPAGTADATPPLKAESGFRVGIDVPLAEWDALKKAAAARKVNLVRLLLQSYMETVRDLLVAQPDLSKLWSDDISGKSIPVFQAKLAAIASTDGGWTAPSPTP